MPDGVKEAPLVTPPVQAYVLAPLAVIVTVLPAQTAVLDTTADTVGVLLTTMVTLAEDIHADPSVVDRL